MNPQLLDKAKSLSVDERIELVEAIWDTLAEDAPGSVLPVSAEHRTELDRRLADLDSRPDDGSSWTEVRERLEKG